MLLPEFHHLCAGDLREPGRAALGLYPWSELAALIRTLRYDGCPADNGVNMANLADTTIRALAKL